MLSGDKLKFLRIMHEKKVKEVAQWCNVSDRFIYMVEAGQENLSEETYNAFLNCIYGIGNPLPSTPRYNQTKRKKELAEEENADK